jgi:hypothetical protein
MTDPSSDPSSSETPSSSERPPEPATPSEPTTPSEPGTPAQSEAWTEPSPTHVPMSGVPAYEASDVPPSEAVPAWAPPEPPHPATPISSVVRAAVLVALGIGILGAAVGWFWAEIAPRLQVIKSDRGFLYADAEPEQPIAGDGLFLFIGVGLGILLAVLVWVLLRRYRGAAMLVALSVGSLVGAALAFWVGHKIGVSQFNAVRNSAPIGAQLSAPVTLRVTDLNFDKSWWPNGVVAAQALAAAFTYTALSGFSAYDDLGRHRSSRVIEYQPGGDLG